MQNISTATCYMFCYFCLISSITNSFILYQYISIYTYMYNIGIKCKLMKNMSFISIHTYMYNIRNNSNWRNMSFIKKCSPFQIHADKMVISCRLLLYTVYVFLYLASFRKFSHILSKLMHWSNPHWTNLTTSNSLNTGLNLVV